MIPFNKPPRTGEELEYIKQAIESDKLCGGGEFSRKCEKWVEEHFETPKALLTPSCTASLELAAILIDIKEGDEVIMSSYTFVSTANAFVLRGAKIVFVDIRPDTMNIDETKIEAAITDKTKAIVPVHYAGVACEMDTIIAISRKYDLWVIEDAAQAVMSTYKGKALGSIGHIGCYSFHETKNYSSGGEGGAILINSPELIERAEIVREKGTNRNQFFRGMVDKYSWVDLGSSYLPSEVQAAYLWAGLQNADAINEVRLNHWQKYYDGLEILENQSYITRPIICNEIEHNAHMFYIKVANVDVREKLIDFLKNLNVMAVFHYVPLHSALAGKKFGCFNGNDTFTTSESERLIRLPMYYNLSSAEVSKVIRSVYKFFECSYEK